MKMIFSKNINLLLFVFLFPTSVLSQGIAPLKKEAIEFSKSIMEAYFSHESETLYRKFSSNLYSVEDQEFFNEDCYTLELRICEAMLETARKFRDKTFEDYLKDYDLQVFSKSEFEKENLKEEYFESGLKDFKILESDFFVLPTDHISGKGYVWNELELLVIRKLKGKKWFIVAWL